MYIVNTLKNVYKKEHEQHPFHLVDPSPWPICTAFAALTLTVGGVMWFHNQPYGFLSLSLGFFSLLFYMYRWFQDIITESSYQGHHTRRVVAGLKYGMLLFIASEIMFFFSFFWAYFHFSLSPSIWSSGEWPPKGINPVQPCMLPALNTFLLLSSGVTLTWAHAEIISGNRRKAIKGVFFTLFLAVAFTACQFVEYKYSALHINDSVYGSIFYLVTGFHGFHVIIGTIFIFVCLLRMLSKKHVTFTRQHHFGFVAALWYWHFVDVIWIFVYFIIYIWGGLGAWTLFGPFSDKDSLFYYVFCFKDLQPGWSDN